MSSLVEIKKSLPLFIILLLLCPSRAFCGSIIAWGWNYYGQCDVPWPNSGFVAIAAGWYHCLGLKSDGSIVAWGRNNDGQCDVPSPNSGFVAIGGGASFSLGLQSAG